MGFGAGFQGNLYAGGGTGAKLYRIGSDGKGKMMADLDALEIHAIAVDSKDRVYAATSPDGKVYRITGNNKPEILSQIRLGEAASWGGGTGYGGDPGRGHGESQRRVEFAVVRFGGRFFWRERRPAADGTGAMGDGILGSGINLPSAWLRGIGDRY